MVINPIDNTVTEIEPVNQMNYFATTVPASVSSSNSQLAKKRGDVVAMAPKDHLRALQQDLIKRGYRKVK